MVELAGNVVLLSDAERVALTAAAIAVLARGSDRELRDLRSALHKLAGVDKRIWIEVVGSGGA